MAMKLRGKWISVIIASVLSLAPPIVVCVGGVCVNKHSPLWYALVAPYMPGVIVSLLMERHGLRSFNWQGICGFAPAFLCWFALAEGVRTFARQQTAKARWQALTWVILFLFLFGLGAKLLYGAWHVR